MNIVNEINIPVDEFNCHEKFVRDIIIYNFNVPALRNNRYNTKNLKFEEVIYNYKENKVKIKLAYVIKEYASIVISVNRFKQFINGVFDFDSIIQKYDKTENIIWHNFDEVVLNLLTSDNFVIVKYKHNHISPDGIQSYVKSCTPGKYYLALKINNNRLILITRNDFVKESPSYIIMNNDNRFDEYAITTYGFKDNKIYPIHYNATYSILDPESGCFINDISFSRIYAKNGLKSYYTEFFIGDMKSSIFSYITAIEIYANTKKHLLRRTKSYLFTQLAEQKPLSEKLQENKSKKIVNITEYRNSLKNNNNHKLEDEIFEDVYNNVSPIKIFKTDLNIGMDEEILLL